ncbi:MAG TPA: hypothetical protein VE135_10895 [Pyrinomonadaceae bacterium]|nr:hypothetical protein [Pyrinomonadaceae bacterium]
MENDANSLLAYFDLTSKPAIGLFCARSEEEFDRCLESILERAVDHIEKNANFLCEQREEGISAYLVAYLNIPGVIRAIQEAHSNGHVDITVEAEHHVPIRRRLGEAKIYNGASYHVKGLEQLLQRYMTGREGGSFLVEYVKLAGIASLVQKLREYLDSNLPCSQDGACENSDIRWAFSSKHLHRSGELLRVLHLNCNVNGSLAKA